MSNDKATKSVTDRLIVPAGKKVIIRGNGAPLFRDPIFMLLDEDLQLQISSHFQPLVAAGSTTNHLVQVVGGSAAQVLGFGFSGASKHLGYQLWTGSEPISGTFSSTLRTITDAKIDVWDRATKLMKLPLPLDVGLLKTGKDAWGKEFTGLGLIAPGPSLAAVVMDVVAEVSNSQTVLLPMNYTKVSIQLGVLYFDWVVIERVEPVFSREVQEIKGKYYPLHCRLTITFKTLFSAYQQLVDQMDGNSLIPKPPGTEATPASLTTAPASTTTTTGPAVNPAETPVAVAPAAAPQPRRGSTTRRPVDAETQRQAAEAALKQQEEEARAQLEEINRKQRNAGQTYDRMPNLEAKATQLRILLGLAKQQLEIYRRIVNLRTQLRDSPGVEEYRDRVRHQKDYIEDLEKRIRETQRRATEVRRRSRPY